MSWFEQAEEIAMFEDLFLTELRNKDDRFRHKHVLQSGSCRTKKYVMDSGWVHLTLSMEQNSMKTGKTIILERYCKEIDETFRKLH